MIILSIKRAFLFLLFSYLVVGAFLFIFQREFMYFPVEKNKSNLDYESFFNDGYSIKMSVINRGKENAILYFGGNAEDVDKHPLFVSGFDNYTVYLLKYRGYGGSSGIPEEKAFYQDALKMYEIIQGRHRSVSVVGRSMGSSVASFLASKKNIKKLALITPFDSAQCVAQSRLPIYPMSLMLLDKHDSVGRVDDIQAETLIIAAENDDVIDITHTIDLSYRFGNRAEFKIINNVDHNSILESEEYKKIMLGFFYVPDEALAKTG